MGPCGSQRGVVSRPLQTIIGRCWRMPRHSDSTSKATGRDLIGQAQDVWQEVGGSIPPQQRQDLGQVLTELGSRINYTCTGQTTDTKSKYSTLGGSELASHAQKMIQRISGQLPVDSSRSLTLVIAEMAQRVRYAAEGEPQTSGNGEGFDFSEGMKQSQHQGSVTFA